jgi:hypothetical protein
MSCDVSSSASAVLLSFRLVGSEGSRTFDTAQRTRLAPFPGARRTTTPFWVIPSRQRNLPNNQSSLIGVDPELVPPWGFPILGGNSFARLLGGAHAVAPTNLVEANTPLRVRMKAVVNPCLVAPFEPGHKPDGLEQVIV